eukprot:SAG11_NODE_17197_length_525_cov_1.338028_1_plen_83_part_10
MQPAPEPAAEAAVPPPPPPQISAPEPGRYQLYVRVLEAKQLASMDGSSDPYVTCGLDISTEGKKQTSTQNGIDPIWHEVNWNK